MTAKQRHRGGMRLTRVRGKCRICKGPMTTPRISHDDRPELADIDICARCVALALCRMAVLTHGPLAGGIAGGAADRPMRAYA